MIRRILINVTATQLRIAITEDGRLVELFTERPESENRVGNIYLGRVSKIVQGMNAAFINIGLEQDAFLHFSDVDSTMEEDRADTDDDDDDRPTAGSVESTDVALRTAKPATGQRLPTFFTKRSGQITINLQPKQNVIVQVTRDAYHQKGVRVTTKVGIPGRNVVLMPFEEAVGVSRRIYSVKERKRLRAVARRILPEGMGCIIRTAASGLSEEDVERDFSTILEEWNEVEKEVKNLKLPGVLRQEAGIAHSVIRDLFKDDVNQVIVDDRKLYREIKQYVQRTAPHLDGKIELFADPGDLFAVYKIETDVQLTHARKVPLPSGGSIVLDHTEAMVVVDVNSGRASHEKSQEGNALKTNMEAAKEIAKQLRLRDIGGIILVDFIDFQQEDNRRKLLNLMKDELARDRAKTVVYPLTQVGLLQMTRQRIRQSMAERSSEDCPMCFGSGRVQAPDATMDAIERWLRNFRARSWKLRVTVAAHPYIIHYMERNKNLSTRRWMRKYTLLVSLREDDKLDAGEFRCYVPGQAKDVTRQFL